MIWPKSAQMPAAWFEAFKLILTRGSISYLIRGFSVWSSLKMQQATHFSAWRSPARCCFVLPFRRFSKLVTRWQEMTASLACLLGLQLQFVLQKKFLLVPPFLGWVGGGSHSQDTVPQTFGDEEFSSLFPLLHCLWFGPPLFGLLCDFKGFSAPFWVKMLLF